ncbi:MAG: hypothetical protein JNL67_04605 [Planctomycetaceae bacterium]|nr:hypothetical protein [Planctomycetaceae bacterium]
MIKTFANDFSFLQQHTDTILLGDPSEAAIVLVPAYQGRVMTSTAGGAADHSFGWINYDLIRRREIVPQINLYGGEERFWLAPEGGRFSIFFPPAELNRPLDFADWRVPPCIDTDPFGIVQVNATSARFAHQAAIQNRAGTAFDLGFERHVELLNAEQVAEALELDPADLRGVPLVAHRSHNTLRNLGAKAWEPTTGLMSIWVLGMNAPSPNATLIVPYATDGVAANEPIVNADYFGVLGPDRLLVDQDRQVITLRGDGEYRSKLGLTHPRAKPCLGAWDKQRQVFTLVHYKLPRMSSGNSSQTSKSHLARRADGLLELSDRLAYVNNLWKVVDDEYQGDVINGYNDGPNESGSKLGGFFELESLSPALALAPQQAYTHTHLTVHLEARDQAAFQQIHNLSQRLLGFKLT